jgi:predicted acetyltransferase
MRLVAPAPEWQDAFQEMVRDYEVAGESRYSLALRDFPAFLRIVERDREQRALPQGRVPALHFWLEHSGTLLGRSSLRLQLNAALEQEGGHVGYDVRPSARRRGIGTELLRLTLIEARARGIVRVRITCDSDNLGSCKIIERNGGVFAGQGVSDDSGKVVRRYWVELPAG